MKPLSFPHVILPREFVELMKLNPTALNSTEIFDLIKSNRALFEVLTTAFKEFNDGRGLEKTMVALGWANFRDRFASLYVYKAIHGKFPLKTDMSLVEDIQKFEATYAEMSVSGPSRAFLLGFYLKLAQIRTQGLEKNKFLEFRLPEDLILPVLRISQGRADKIDWLVLMVYHVANAVGEKVLARAIMSGKTFDDIYGLLDEDSRRRMHENLLSYGMSIHEPELFLYEKV